MILRPVNSLRELNTTHRLASIFRRGIWTQDFRQNVRSLAHTATLSLSRQVAIKGWMATEETLDPLVPICEEWLTQLCSKKSWNWQDQKLVSLIASCLCITDYDDVHSQFYTEILSRNTDYLERNPAFLCKIENHSVLNATAETQLSHLNKTFSNNIKKAHLFFKRTNSISNFIENQSNINSIAIVGNAPGLLDNNHGELIDDADLVIRFNNVVINDSNKHKTGNKTDVWVINPGYKLSKTENKPANSLWLSSYYPFKRPNTFWQSIDDCAFTEHYFSNHKHWHTLTKQLNAPPSAGLLCVSTLADTTCKLSVYGFSGISGKSEDRQNGQSDTNNHYGDSNKRSSRHNWEAESIVLKQLRDRVIFF